MPSRIYPLARSLALLLFCALAACKPTTPQSADASPDAATASLPASTSAPTGIAEAAARLNPLASPKDRITASLRKFMAVRSFHASMQFNGPGGAISNEVDFVAPDRFRMQMPMGAQVIIGDTMYMSVDGRTMKVPMPKGTLSQWRDPAKLAGNEATMTVQAQGRDNIDGISAHKYLVHNTQPQPSDVTIWVGDDGLPVQIQGRSTVKGQAADTTIRYSRFNDPTLEVEPPK